MYLTIDMTYIHRRTLDAQTTTYQYKLDAITRLEDYLDIVNIV